jgi:hypothetical protein
MKYYSGLDVSLKETFISIIDGNGSTVKESFVPTDVLSISDYLKEGGLSVAIVSTFKWVNIPRNSG